MTQDKKKESDEEVEKEEEIKADETVLEKEEVLEEKEVISDENAEKVVHLENQFKRALADYANLEKRMVEERRNWVQLANKNLLLRIFPAFDTLEIALKHSQDKGLALAVQQILDSLKQEGVEKIPTKGQEFDPYTMECVQTLEGEENKVIEEVRSGYTLFDKVIRPAQVVVGKSV